MAPHHPPPPPRRSPPPRGWRRRRRRRRRRRCRRRRCRRRRLRSGCDNNVPLAGPSTSPRVLVPLLGRAAAAANRGSCHGCHGPRQRLATAAAPAPPRAAGAVAAVAAVAAAVAVAAVVTAVSMCAAALPGPCCCYRALMRLPRCPVCRWRRRARPPPPLPPLPPPLLPRQRERPKPSTPWELSRRPRGAALSAPCCACGPRLALPRPARPRMLNRLSLPFGVWRRRGRHHHRGCGAGHAPPLWPPCCPGFYHRGCRFLCLCSGAVATRVAAAAVLFIGGRVCVF